jgi:lipid-binding SYLF domain-containing protein
MLNLARTLIVGLVIVGLSGPALADEKQQTKRERVNIAAETILTRLLAENARAKELYKIAYGYAVFDNIEDRVTMTEYRGAGVAVAKTTTGRVHMKMAEMHKDPHPGPVRRQVVFLLRTKAAYDTFVKYGWEAGLSYQNALKDEDDIPEGEFRDGIAIYSFSDDGLDESADLTNSKYWAPNRFNQ